MSKFYYCGLVAAVLASSASFGATATYDRVVFSNMTPARFVCRTLKVDRRWLTTDTKVTLKPASLSAPSTATIGHLGSNESWSCQPQGKALLNYSIRTQTTVNEKETLFVNVVADIH